MSTRDELVDTIAHDLSGRYSAATRDRAVAIVDGVLDHLAAEGMVVLGPDGEPLDVRPALRLQGRYADLVAGKRGSEWLAQRGLSWQLADACLAAAEVDG